MRKTFIALLLVLFLSEPAFCWEMYVTNETSSTITVYDQSGALIKTITDPLIQSPRQLAFRRDGILYVASYANSRIVKINQNDNVIGYIQTPQNTYIPSGLTIRDNNHLYVAVAITSGGGFIAEYDENDSFVKSFNGGLNPFTPPAMNIGPNGHLYTAHGGAEEFDSDGTLLNIFPTGGSPRGIAIGPDGYIYVARDLINDIGVFNPTTFQLERTITGFTGPYGITFNPDNQHLFVANFGANNILEYLHTGEFIGVFASGLSHPNHIAFKSSIPNTTTTTISTTTTTQTPVPFEATFNWSNSFQIYGWQPIPQVDGFDYYFSPEKKDTAFAGHKIRVDFIEVTAPGTSLGDVTNFDIEVHLNGRDITLPEGQFLKTNVDPVSGYTRNAQVQYDPIIGGPNGSNSYTFSATYDFILGTGSAYPALNAITRAINSEMNITDGLHAQLFFWTGDNRNCKIQFSGATLKVKDVILDTPTTTTTTTTNPNPCLVSYYPFNGNANDESGNGRTGTVYGATLTSDRFGSPNSAYDFNGVDNYIETPNNLNNYQNVSVAFWMNMRRYPVGSRFQVISNDGGAYGRVINVNNDKTIEFFNSVTYFRSNIVLSLDQWCFMTAVWTGGYSRLYINGELKIDGSGSIDGLNDLTSYFIGKPTWTNGLIPDYFDGVIDDLRIYNCPLTEAEIQQLYNQTPTLISLTSFTAVPKVGRVILAWSTESEIDNAGFNIYRSESENGNYSKINVSLILADGSSTQGASYEFIDNEVQNRKTYYYKLESIDFSGKSTMHGPVQATPRWIYRVGK